MKNCNICKGLDTKGGLCVDTKEIGLDYMFPKCIPIKIFFIAESPPAPGKGFFYDESSLNTKFREKLFELINASGLGLVNNLSDFNQKGYYLADAINCRWDKNKAKYLNKKIFSNCSIFLKQQINLFKPISIVVMGKNAKTSLRLKNVSSAIQRLNIQETNIVEMTFPLGICQNINETDEDRIKKMNKLIKRLRKFSRSS